IQKLGKYAFDDTLWLQNRQNENPFVIENNMLIDGKKCTGDIVIPDNIKTICDAAFENCDDITNVDFPESLTYIGEWAFAECDGITAVIIHDNVLNIGERAFRTCRNISNIIIGSGLTEIGSDVFGFCTAVESVVVPENITSLGWQAFFSCTNLKSITIENPDCNIYGANSTISNKVANVVDYYYDGVIYGYTNSTAQKYAEKFDCNFVALDAEPVVTTTAATTAATTASTTVSTTETTTTSATVRITVPVIVSTAGTTSSISTTAPITVSTTVSTTAPYYPTVTTTTIKSLAYEKIDEDNDGTYDYVEITGCNNTLTEIGIPEVIDGLSVKAIATNAFNGCESLESITIPASVTEIGSLAFFMCSSLKNINVDDENTVFCDVDGVLFCYATDRIGELILWQYPTGRTESEYILPENTAVIGNDAFAMSALESIVINEALIGIRNAAFTECANLKSLTIPENVTFVEQIFNCSCYLPDEITIENPDLDISTIFDMAMATFSGTIKGYDGSTAESYAEEKGYIFESLGEAPVVTTPAVTTAVTTTAVTTQTTATQSQTTTSQTQVTTVQTQVTTTALIFGTPTIMGDSDNDGSVGLADVAVVAKYAVSTTLYYIDDPVAAANADVNHDWLVNAADVQMMIEFMLKKITELPF
ncbi:MAG: leucine-rich repeat protein, partial [Clostridia bacterium]|nr:leucine-rich repeat protein [Clostridia bacterium]